MSKNQEATQQLSSIPFGALIGGPLNAAVEAQSQSAITTLKFILGALYGKDTFGADTSQYLITDSSKSNAAGTQDNLPNVTPASKDPEIIQLRLSYNTDSGSSVIDIPLITILPIPYLEITDLNIVFDATISAMQQDNSNTESSSKKHGQASASGGFWGQKYKMSGGFSSDTKSSSKSKSELSTEYKIHVDLKATNRSMPEGMSRILRMLNVGISATSTPVEGEAVPVIKSKAVN